MLTAKHFFPFLRMVKAMQLKDALKNLVKLFKDSKSVSEEQGIELLWELFAEGLPNAENEAFAFLAAYTGRPREEIEQLPIEDLFGLFKQLLAEPQLKSFLAQVSGSTDQQTPTT